MQRLPKRSLDRMERLARHLEEKPTDELVGSSIALHDASLAPGWLVQRAHGEKKPRSCYHVWTHEGRDPSVPWALGPPHHEVDRAGLAELLRRLWLPHARNVLAAHEHSTPTEELSPVLHARGKCLWCGHPAEGHADATKACMYVLPLETNDPERPTVPVPCDCPGYYEAQTERFK